MLPEDGVVLTGPGRKAERHAEAAASADRLIAELAASESRSLRESRLGRLHHEIAGRTGLSPSGAGVVLAIAGGIAFLLAIVLALTVLGLLI